MTRDETLALLQPTTASLLPPIAGESPVGGDPATDGEFAALQRELDKLTQPSGGAVDWNGVRTLAASVLTRCAKDLRVATWLAAALCHEPVWRGLPEALAFLLLFVEDWGTACFPQRPRARANQWVWFAEHIQRLVEHAADPTPGDAVIPRCVGLAESLSESISRQSGSRDVVLIRLLEALRRRVPHTETLVTPAPASAHDTQPPVDAGRSSSPEGARGSLPGAVGALIDAAVAARAVNPADESAYRFLRVAVYLQETPPVAKERQTKVAAPAPGLREQLRRHAAEGRWSDLVERAEGALVQHPWYLDLHRWSAMGLDQQGGRFQAARVALGREVTHLLLRLPGVMSLKFSDGTPFCDTDTQEWLSAERLLHLWNRSESERAELAAEAEALRAFQSARDLAAAGDAVAGLRVAVAAANRASDARGRFKGRLSAARLALDHKLFSAARSLLDGLLAEVDAGSLKLEAWEPELSAQLFVARLECGLAQGSGCDERTRERLYRIDPASALRFEERST